MEVLAHRGLWRQPSDGNSLEALVGAAEAGFGIEFDVRDARGEVVVAHDPVPGDSLPLEDLLWALPDSVGTLAVNIKSDGIAPPVADAIAGREWFAFDMSGPQTLAYLAIGAPVFTRISDIEPQPLLADEASGFWIDAMRDDWLTTDVLLALAMGGRRLAIVSPELHGRAHQATWDMLRGLPASLGERMMLCTDYPREAREFFGSTG
jgi:glycerophosphoryl diester phosphodiesterase